ncbi:MAG TPA: pentapeptide repeat-containing protein [Kofleriaceae bacterium]|nr:pentapeptide repeat-containing protein [Kofleriaceae bacterium]
MTTDPSELLSFHRALARGQRSFVGLTLPWNADLHGISLAGCDLTGACLRGARLDAAQLDGCKLTEADLRSASLRRAVLVRADLRGADLRGADLRDADLTKADLCEADLVAADLRGATLEGAAISFGCRGYAGVKLSGLTVRHLYSLLLMTRPDDPKVVLALESLRAALALPESEQRVLVQEAALIEAERLALHAEDVAEGVSAAGAEAAGSAQVGGRHG